MYNKHCGWACRLISPTGKKKEKRKKKKKKKALHRYRLKGISSSQAQMYENILVYYMTSTGHHSH